MDAKNRTLGASERDAAARARWRQQMSGVDVRRLVFVDEAGTHEAGTPTALARLDAYALRGLRAQRAQRAQRAHARVPRTHGTHEAGTPTALARLDAYALRGQRAQRAHARVPRHHGTHTTLVGALPWQGLQAPWTIEGAMDTAAFAVYIREVLAPTLQPGQIVILDNLSVHTSPAIQQLIEAHGGQLVFLPAYSPDLLPIEQAFSQLKAILRRLAARTREVLLDALAAALAALTPAEAHAWFRHAGYSSLAQAP